MLRLVKVPEGAPRADQASCSGGMYRIQVAMEIKVMQKCDHILTIV